ncbi:MAG TPA: hypothetical protein VH681_14945 [Nitrospiraceae bacterium]|jgi:hypothetical protein
MSLIWCAISGHGYGHAAQMVPILNALEKRIPDLQVILRTTVPSAFFQDRLTVRWDHQAVQQDVGCIQDGPLAIDIAATWAEHHRFHASWPERLAEEVAALRRVRPNLLLANTAYLPLAAATRVGVQPIAIASLTWDEILSRLHSLLDPDQQTLVSEIRKAYASADLALRIAPGLPMPAFSEIQDIGPIASPSPSQRDALRTMLGLEPHEKLVLVGFGGIPLRRLPWNEMQSMQTFRFIVDGHVESLYSRVISLTDVPLRFSTVLASVDLVMTKPGYGTITECVANGTPVIYVRRYNFADEQPLVTYLLRYGRGVELNREDFQRGAWLHALEEALALPAPADPPPALTGAEQAAQCLASFCR